MSAPATRRARGHARTRPAAALQRSTGQLATAATARMDAEMPWFRDLSAEERSWVGTIVQAGIQSFVAWYAEGPGNPIPRTSLAGAMFGSVPSTLTGVITLQQTVELIRLSIDVVEENLDGLLDADDSSDVGAAIARYAREVAFATAQVYARAAEQRGAWDARLEALLVDAVLRAEADETLLSRASALGWHARSGVAVVLGAAPRGNEGEVIESVRHRARAARLEALCAVQGDRLVVLLGGVSEVRPAAEQIAGLFGEGPVVAGPLAPDLSSAHLSARAALASHRAAVGWPEAPRPALSDELLPERVLAGDDHARRFLVDDVYGGLRGARSTLIDSLSAYFATGGSIEATARQLFVHPNTVRYRLRQAAQLTGFDPAEPRDALVLQIALALGRQADAGL